MAKMNNKWVVLCSAAVAAIYSAGYMATETEASVQQLPLAQYTPAPASGNHTSAAAGGSQIKSQYKNGTFYGSGSNRRGSIQVGVTITNGKIKDVEISRFAMHYTIDDVVGLPQEVVRLQSAQVRNVSGATYSTEAFKAAVQDALAKAKNG